MRERHPNLGESQPNLGKWESVEFFKPEDFNILPEWSVLIANRANAYLAERGVRVYGHESKHANQWIYGTAENPCDAERRDTHTALLIDVKPIVRDTAESLLREIIDAVKPAELWTKATNDVFDRARKLLEADK